MRESAITPSLPPSIAFQFSVRTKVALNFCADIRELQLPGCENAVAYHSPYGILATWEW